METLIDDILGKAERGELNVTKFFQSLATTQSDVFTYLFDEDTRLLVEPEHDFLLYISMIILEVISADNPEGIVIDIDSLEEAAEDNWGFLEHTSIENISETMTSHPAAPLYLFVEDSCAPETDHEVLSEAAVELVCVQCTRIIDAAYPTPA
jgi:hypothetical protein